MKMNDECRKVEDPKHSQNPNTGTIVHVLPKYRIPVNVKDVMW